MLQLRSATASDADLLYRCNNDPSTREVSRSVADISQQEHQRWLSTRLADPGCSLYIIEAASLPAGNLRLQRLKDTDAVEPVMGRRLTRSSIYFCSSRRTS